MVDAEAISYLDDLLEEYLLFRGFTGSLRQFQAERKNDKLKGFQVCLELHFSIPLREFTLLLNPPRLFVHQVAKLVAQLFSLVHSQRLTELLELWSYLGTSFFSRFDFSSSLQLPSVYSAMR
jgi:hypothetical protein